MKGFVKVVVWIIILAAVCVGVYFVLPEYPQNYVKSMFQPMTDAVAKSKIEQVQSLLCKDVDDASYKTIFEAKTKNPCWVYEKDEATGAELVTFRGTGVSLNLKDYEEYGGMLYTDASVKIVFEIVDNKVDIHPYIDGELMEIEDGKHSDQNKVIRNDLFRQLYGGMASANE